MGCIVGYDLCARRIALMGKKKDEGGVEKGRHPVSKVMGTLYMIQATANEPTTI